MPDGVVEEPTLCRAWPGGQTSIVRLTRCGDTWESGGRNGEGEGGRGEGEGGRRGEDGGVGVEVKGNERGWEETGKNMEKDRGEDW